MKTFTGIAVLTTVLFLFSGMIADPAEAAPPGKVWVPKHTLPDGTVIPGHWRPAKKPGFVWVAGHYDGDVWIAGYWKPVGAPPANKVWKPGYWRNGKWHAGKWIRVKTGKKWIPGHSRRGKWIPGHWR